MPAVSAFRLDPDQSVELHAFHSVAHRARRRGRLYREVGIVLCTGPAFVADENKMARDVMRRRGQ
jgi:hypothetical protein